MKCLALIAILGLFTSSLGAPFSPATGNLIEEIIEDTITMEKLSREIKSSLELVKILPSSILARKVNEAVVVLSQALSNPNPVLRNACEIAMLSMKESISTHNGRVLGTLTTFLANLKEQLGSPGSMFPEKFATWLKNQIQVVEATVQYNQGGLDILSERMSTKKAGILLKNMQDRVTSFEDFVKTGLNLAEAQPSLQFNLELSEMKTFLAMGKFDGVSTEIVWILLTDDNIHSIQFLPALSEIHKRSNSNLQAIPEAILQSIETFLKSLSQVEYHNFLEQLGSWNSLEGFTISTRQ